MSLSTAAAAFTARNLVLGLLSCAGLVPAFIGCSDDEHPNAPVVAAGRAGGPGRAGSSSQAATSGVDFGGATGEDGAAAAGSHPEGGAPALGSAGDTQVGPPNVGGDPGLTLDDCPSDARAQPSELPGVCSIIRGWTTGTTVPVASGNAPSLVAVTPNELTLLWSEAPSSIAVYFVADRESTGDVFGEPQELPFGRVLGLSPDGLRLTLRADDGSLAETTRSARGESFGTPQAGAFEKLDADAAIHHLTLGDVVIASDDRTLFYGAWSLDTETLYPVHVSQRNGSDPWPVGAILEACELKAYGAFGPHPTGISADGLTLFFLDGARGKARAAFRASGAAAFSWYEELPNMAAPQPNEACDRLYFSPTSGEPGMLFAPRAP
jgi:hypothetical protein